MDKQAVFASYFKGNLSNVDISSSATLKFIATSKGGTLTTDEMWLGGQVYEINSDIVVPSGVSLTILPGAILGLIAAVAATLLTKAPSGDVTDLFDEVVSKKEM